MAAISKHPAWLTRDEIPADRCRVLFLPDDPNWLADFIGAILPLSRAYNWEQYGTLTPDEMAQEWTDIISVIDFRRECLSIGTVLWTAGGVKPVNALWADGAEVEIAEFPLLYSVVGDAWGTADSGNFKLPNLFGRFPVGADPSGSGQYQLADTGGEDTHTLTVAEMPAHTHSVHDHELGVIGVELLPASTPALLPTVTGSTGGGEAHENRPPYAALNPYIIAR